MKKFKPSFEYTKTTKRLKFQFSFLLQKSGIFGPDGPNGLGGQTGGQTGISTGGSSTGGPDGGLAAGGLETEFPDSDVNCDAVGTCYDGKKEI